MTTFLKRSGAALLSLVLLCVLAMGAGAASSQTVGVKFWKERSDKESMANSGIDADRTATLTRSGVKKAEPPTDGSAQLRQKCRNFCTSRSAPRTSIVSPSRKQ